MNLMKKLLFLLPIFLVSTILGQSSREAMLERARGLELPTKYEPPPGDPLEHHAAGFAKVVCSAVFITGLDAEFAAENVGYFTAPYAERAKMGRPVPAGGRSPGEAGNGEPAERAHADSRLHW